MGDFDEHFCVIFGCGDGYGAESEDFGGVASLGMRPCLHSDICLNMHRGMKSSAMTCGFKTSRGIILTRE